MALNQRACSWLGGVSKISVLGPSVVWNCRMSSRVHELCQSTSRPPLRYTRASVRSRCRPRSAAVTMMMKS